MVNSIMADFYVGKFDYLTDALTVLDYALEIAERYGYTSIADMHELIGDKSAYIDCKYGWTLSSLVNASAEKLATNMYSIHMPACDWISSKEDTMTITKFPIVKPKKTEPEPINVTIPADKPEVIEQTIGALFNDSEKIKDRPIFISIM